MSDTRCIKRDEAPDVEELPYRGRRVIGERNRMANWAA